MLAELRKALSKEISEEFHCITDGIVHGTSNISFQIPYYCANKFIIPFKTTVTDNKKPDIYTEIDYLYVIENNNIIESYYYKEIDDDYGYFKRHKKYHMELVEKKRSALVGYVSNYDVLNLKFNPNSTEETFQDILAFFKSDDIVELSRMWE
jgi:hypothetical protein